MVSGYQGFEPGTKIAGVILNQVGGGRHEGKLRIAIERYCRIPVLGALPKESGLEIPDRHLGLVPQGEHDALAPVLEACRQAAERYLDLDAIQAIARAAPGLPDLDAQPAAAIQPAASIGVVRDRAFSFYYPENLEALERAGARLVFVDALQTPALPRMDALYIGGGFPEVFMEALAANRGLLDDIRSAVEAGMPVYAECGGLMLLSRRIVWGARRAEMAGVLPCDVEVLDRPVGHGYVLGETLGKDAFLTSGTRLRGHEFHHSRITNLADGAELAYRLERGNGIQEGMDGLVYRNVLAGYTHLHAHGVREWAPALVRRALDWREGRA
jgi:cobyrinic acid a,c-diamide synthase